MKKLSGKDGAVLVDGVAFCVKNWRFNEMVNTIDVTDTCSDGFAEFIPTFRTGSGSMQAFFDQDNPPEIDPGDVVAVQLITNNSIGSGVGYKFNAIVESREVSSDVGGAVEYNINFKATGSVTSFVVSV